MQRRITMLCRTRRVSPRVPLNLAGDNLGQRYAAEKLQHGSGGPVTLGESNFSGNFLIADRRPVCAPFTFYSVAVRIKFAFGNFYEISPFSANDTTMT